MAPFKYLADYQEWCRQQCAIIKGLKTQWDGFSEQEQRECAQYNIDLCASVKKFVESCRWSKPGKEVDRLQHAVNRLEWSVAFLSCDIVPDPRRTNLQLDTVPIIMAGSVERDRKKKEKLKAKSSSSVKPSTSKAKPKKKKQNPAKRVIQSPTPSPPSSRSPTPDFGGYDFTRQREPTPQPSPHVFSEPAQPTPPLPAAVITEPPQPTPPLAVSVITEQPQPTPPLPAAVITEQPQPTPPLAVSVTADHPATMHMEFPVSQTAIVSKGIITFQATFADGTTIEDTLPVPPTIPTPPSSHFKVPLPMNNGILIPQKFTFPNTQTVITVKDDPLGSAENPIIIEDKEEPPVITLDDSDSSDDEGMRTLCFESDNGGGAVVLDGGQDTDMEDNDEDGGNEMDDGFLGDMDEDDFEPPFTSTQYSLDNNAMEDTAGMTAVEGWLNAFGYYLD
ncbi:proteoglycan 4-like [Paramacrobiotus metropolitanus]|uniref:proteoglycan 4-like n=2 Tax=Paramacrobiotus metropolitanus TaxID=2943436 RepID=UPI002446181B|nr:proteoglycan 4-like [Paramacrobiotus metropolitanus]XP_055340537.1 proteoglycan 4-like [Paramacrobiotus metropolitanus]